MYVNAFLTCEIAKKKKIKPKAIYWLTRQHWRLTPPADLSAVTNTWGVIYYWGTQRHNAEASVWEHFFLVKDVMIVMKRYDSTHLYYKRLIHSLRGK